jgi:SlyX protein
MMTQDLNERIETLEMRVMHQDQTIADLDATITAQWRIIDTLKRQMTQLDDRMREAAAAPGGQTVEPPPPHY